MIAPDARYLINPGSVGQPRDGDPRAAYARGRRGTRASSCGGCRTTVERAATIIEAGLARRPGASVCRSDADQRLAGLSPVRFVPFALALPQLRPRSVTRRARSRESSRSRCRPAAPHGMKMKCAAVIARIHGCRLVSSRARVISRSTAPSGARATDVAEQRHPDEARRPRRPAASPASARPAAAASTGTNPSCAAALRGCIVPSAGAGAARTSTSAIMTSTAYAMSSDCSVLACEIQRVELARAVLEPDPRRSATRRTAGTRATQNQNGPRMPGSSVGTTWSSDAACARRSPTVDERHVRHAEQRHGGGQLVGARARRTGAAAGRRRRSSTAPAPTSAARPTATTRPRPCAPRAAR